mgnify:CR=1 FL=1
MEQFKKNLLWIVVLALLFGDFLVWKEVLRVEREHLLTVAFLNVGQGDSVYIEGPHGGQILMDGGPNGEVLSELAKVMPFGDTSIDILIVTNPDFDHYGGFLDVFQKYSVGAVIEAGTKTSNESYKELARMIQEKDIPVLIAKRGMTIDLGDGAYLRILFPDRDISNFSRNDGSIISRLEYGSTSVMLTGDTTKIIEEYMVNHYSEDLPSTILKVAHHGSRTSSSKNFVEAVSPTHAIISDGKNNKYGHPHQETLDTLLSFGINILRTDLLGTIVFKSNGKIFTKY